MFFSKVTSITENFDNITLSDTSLNMISHLECNNYNYEEIKEDTKNVLKEFYSKFNDSIAEINKISISEGFVETNKDMNNFVKPRDFNIIPELLQNDINTNLIYKTV